MLRLSIEQKRKLIRYTTIVGVILTVAGSYLISQSDYFKPEGGFSNLLIRMGIWAPILFIFVQISQIVYPIIPLGLTNVIGDLIFGHFFGFIFNAIGMVIGSSINFFLGRRFGSTIVKAFISDSQYENYIGKMNDGPGFLRLLRIGFIAPVFPDDIFCMIAGMSNIGYRKFMSLVIAYRPISMFIYTYMTSNFIQYVYRFFTQ